MEYREKLVWGQFLPILLGCGIYAVDAMRQAHGAKPFPLLSVVVAIVILQVLYLIVVAAITPPEPDDERTRLIELKSFKTGYLATMVVFAFWVSTYLLKPSWLHILERNPVLIVFAWFAVEAVRTGAQLVMYRASVRP
ncbi:hypothetical protein [Granulicella arctica]|uniref:Uncharacterized protein n=1 Tax=Granulicella arctica TaxID=940613 RepID=A0A7Y9PFY0_9BACT|nr:hypothetical protein [Granulicella arctica]NYF79082.1 hypothetical protein [Granulicella arctica]